MEVPNFIKVKGQSYVFANDGTFKFFIPEKYFDTKLAEIKGEFINLFGICTYAIYDKNDNCLASMNIEYCPMCGRKLHNTYLAIQHKSVKNCNKQYNSMDFHCYLNSVFAQTKRR